MYFSKKTGKYFNSQRGLLNHFRYIYTSIEDAYLNEHSINSIPKCAFCSANSKFISFVSGYDEICQSKNCIKQRLKISNKNLGNIRVEKKRSFSNNELAIQFRKFLNDNLSYYKENRLKENIIEPFSKECSKKLTLYSFLRRKYSIEIFLEDRICRFCDKDFKINLLIDASDKYNCNSKKCRDLKNHDYNSASIIFSDSKELNNFIYQQNIDWKQSRQYAKNHDVWKKIFKVDLEKIDNLYFDEKSEWLIPVNHHSDNLKRFLLKCKIDYISYLEINIPNSVISCELCSKKRIIKHTARAVDIDPKPRFCSIRCFNDFRIKHPEFYPHSTEYRNRQSKTMKRKISNGEFTPNITNSWTHWNATIELENGAKKKFRSSWEACFWYCNQELKYEKIRIPYKDGEIIRNYLADFYDEINNIIYEIKPKSNWEKQTNKLEQVIQYCLNHNIKFICIDESNILDYISKELFKENNHLQLKMLLNGIKKT